MVFVAITAVPIHAQTDPNLMRAHAHDFPTEPVWVGQQVTFPVTLSMATRLTGSPRFQLPEATGGILLQLAGRPTFGSETVDGKQFTTWRYSFAYYPHRTGEHTIPAITVRAMLAAADGTRQEITDATKSFAITSKLPPGAEGLATLISTTRFEASPKWQPEPTALRAGDAVTRTITMRAADVLGMGFPPLRFEPQDGVATYPKPPVVKDNIHRGDLTGERTETVVYVFEREGQFTLPDLIIPWFDLNTQELQRVSFPARQFEVAPNPAFVDATEASEETVLPSRWSIPWVIFGVGVAVFVIGLLAAKRAAPRIRLWMKSRQARAGSKEPFLFRQLMSAVQAGDSAAIHTRATRWLYSLDLANDTRTLTAFANRYGDDQLVGAMERLMRDRFGPVASDGESDRWNDPAVVTGLKHARKLCMGKNAPDHITLPPLNPGGKRIPYEEV